MCANHISLTIPAILSKESRTLASGFIVPNDFQFDLTNEPGDIFALFVNKVNQRIRTNYGDAFEFPAPQTHVDIYDYLLYAPVQCKNVNRISQVNFETAIMVCKAIVSGAIQYEPSFTSQQQAKFYKFVENLKVQMMITPLIFENYEDAFSKIPTMQREIATMQRDIATIKNDLSKFAETINNSINDMLHRILDQHERIVGDSVSKSRLIAALKQ
ncbi:hypothetical protein TVAG_182640 [Trichomonas vaginalis G3]|uniref:Uncharacterized protein n=1 Tax=Trichomonas vaginalis (strain ATCC PRA-98 / G3) TaxID=412133 RepID=A2D902_TRIV3|nr:hypothetical protein TVAGG3_0529110 [Trichomonas vaginalis G3]EAY23028.1 hypothetical protein TVAG_182640 [Trichomonas vaginalis G3]KAI5518991.1 hypothetical protein TVAGG3_0529110 [Trichomonas vaginalis G3]|eukprot:XP_001584014.1 hypothetical protein [Trichomonas vaginalis G3]